MSDRNARIDFLRQIGVTTLPDQAATAPGGAPGGGSDAPAAPASATPADPNANAGWQTAAGTGAAVTAHADLRTGAAQPTDATSQVQLSQTYQAHPNNQAGVEVSGAVSFGQTTDRTGQTSQSVGVTAQVGYAIPIGPAITAGQRVTLTPAAGVNLNLAAAGGTVTPQLQPFVQAQLSVPITATAALSASIQQSLTNPQSPDGQRDTQVGIGLTVQIP
jgi:hypothetical protein